MTGINGKNTSMVWPTLGSRTAKEQNSGRVEQSVGCVCVCVCACLPVRATTFQLRQRHHQTPSLLPGLIPSVLMYACYINVFVAHLQFGACYWITVEWADLVSAFRSMLTTIQPSRLPRATHFVITKKSF